MPEPEVARDHACGKEVRKRDRLPRERAEDPGDDALLVDARVDGGRRELRGTAGSGGSRHDPTPFRVSDGPRGSLRSERRPAMTERQATLQPRQDLRLVVIRIDTAA